MRRLPAAVPLLFCLACQGDSRDGPALPGDDARSASPTASASTAPTLASSSASALSSATTDVLPGRGLTHKDNDPDLALELQAVLVACKADLEPMHFLDKTCEPFEKLRKKELTSRAVATWIEVLFDPDPAARRLASVLLKRDALRSLHPDLANKIVDALAHDLGPSPSNTALASLAIELDAREVGARLVTIGTSPKTPLDVRSVLAMWWWADQSYEVTASLASEESKASRLAAVAGYARSFKKHQAEACAYWASLVTDPDERLRRDALSFLSGSFGGFKAVDTESDWFTMGSADGPSATGYRADWCPDQIDGLLDTIEQRVDKRDLSLRPYLEAAGAIADHLMATAPQKKRATAILKKVVEDKTAPDRDKALTVLVETFPSELGYAGRFGKDEALASTVERLRDSAAHMREMFQARREAQAGTKKNLGMK